MRIAALAAFAALALVACNQNNQATTQTANNAAPSAQQGGGGDAFPNLFGATYRAEAVITRDGRTVNAVTYRDGQKLRMEITTGGNSSTVISNPETNESLMITNNGGQQIAMRTELATTNDALQAWRGDLAAKSHRSGDCTVAGEHGSVWEHTDEGGAHPRTVCVTSDGILLRATDNGETVWETTHVQRGPQDAALFRAPPGVRVMTLDPGAAAAARAAIERARAHN